jgi:polyhydroxyalkanoate synthase
MTTMQNPFLSMFPAGAPFVPDVEGFRDRMAAWPRVMEIARNVRVGATPYDVTFRKDRLEVRRYRSDVPKKHRTPLLLVFALVNRPYILDLLPHKSVVQQFLKGGFDVFLIDWGIPTIADKHLTLEHYVERYMHDVVRHVCEEAGTDDASLLGYCMGGTMSAMYTALHQDLIRNFILMAAPIDFSSRESLLSTWTDPKWYDVDKAMDVFGNADPAWLQSSFGMLKPVQNYFEKYINFYDKMTDEKFLEEFFAMETWVNDNIPVAGDTFRQFVKDLFQKNLLVKGEFKLGNKKVELQNITCPVLNLMATADHLVPCSQSAAFNDLVGSRDRKAITFPAGHIGLSVGSKAQRELWPQAVSWLGERSETIRDPKSKK